MEEKRGRGRPSVTQKIAGSNADLDEKVVTNEKNTIPDVQSQPQHMR